MKIFILDITMNKKILFFPILGVGILGFILANLFKTEIPAKPSTDRSTPVNIIPLKQHFAKASIVGFGRVEPKYSWQAIAEINGIITKRSSNLEKGRFLSKGTEVIKIDPLDYQLRLRQAEAELHSANVQLEKLNKERQSLENSLEIEQSRLKLSKSELDRLIKLASRELASQSQIDVARQGLLAQEQVVSELKSKLSLLPSEIKVSKANIDVQSSRVEEAQRLLEKTSITLPFDMVISDVFIERDQAVHAQQVMLSGHSPKVMQVEGQFPMHATYTMFNELGQTTKEKLEGLRDLQATVHLSSGGHYASWPAKVTGISESVDPNQGTVGLILEILQPEKAILLEQPPLINGMFVEVRIEGKKNKHWLIPQHALRGESIYLMDEQNRLKILPVNILFYTETEVAISADLELGSQVVTNDLMPAIEGMKLRHVTTVKERAVSL